MLEPYRSREGRNRGALRCDAMVCAEHKERGAAHCGGQGALQGRQAAGQVLQGAQRPGGLGLCVQLRSGSCMPTVKLCYCLCHVIWVCAHVGPVLLCEAVESARRQWKHSLRPSLRRLVVREAGK